MVKWIRYKHRIPGPQPPDHSLSVQQVRRRYGVSLGVVHYWIERGILPAQQRKRNTPYAVVIDDQTDQHLRDWVAHSARIRRSSPTQAA